MKDRLTHKGCKIGFYEAVYCKASNADDIKIKEQLKNTTHCYKVRDYICEDLNQKDLQDMYVKLSRYENIGTVTEFRYLKEKEIERIIDYCNGCLVGDCERCSHHPRKTRAIEEKQRLGLLIERNQQ